jgi:hypothetical protein
MRNWILRNKTQVFTWALFGAALLLTIYLQGTGHAPPVGVYIALMGGAAAWVTFRVNMSTWEKIGWIAIITLLMFAEIRNLYVSDAEQVAKFGKISRDLETTKEGLEKTARGIDATTAQSQRQFQTTMAQFVGVTKTVSELRAEVRRTSEHLANAHLSDMPSTDLASAAQGIANQLKDYLESYRYRDTLASTFYYDRYTEGGMSQEQRQYWMAVEKRKRSELLAGYENDALRLLAIADRLRAEMLRRLPPTARTPADDLEIAQFENPRMVKATLPLLWRLGEYSEYLENLAKRLLETLEPIKG